MPRAKRAVKKGELGPISWYETTEDGTEEMTEEKAMKEEAAEEKKEEKKKKKGGSRRAGSYLTRRSYRKSAMDEPFDYKME